MKFGRERHHRVPRACHLACECVCVSARVCVRQSLDIGCECVRVCCEPCLSLLIYLFLCIFIYLFMMVDGLPSCGSREGVLLFFLWVGLSLSGRWPGSMATFVVVEGCLRPASPASLILRAGGRRTRVRPTPLITLNCVAGSGRGALFQGPYGWGEPADCFQAIPGPPIQS